MALTLNEAKKRAQGNYIRARLANYSQKQQDLINRYGNYKSSDWHSQDEANAYYNSVKEMRDLTDLYRYYVDTYDSGNKTLSSQLGSAVGSYDDILSGKNDFLDMYSQYTNPEAFNAAYAHMQETAKKYGADNYSIEDKEALLDQLYKDKEVFKGFETAVGIGQSFDMPISDGNGNDIYFADYFPEYDKNADLDTTQGKKDALENLNLDTRIRELEDELRTARLFQAPNLDDLADFSAYSAPTRDAERALKRENLDNHLTDEERARYYYLYNTQGADKATQYAEDLTATLESRQLDAIRKWSGKNIGTGILGTLASFGTSAASMLESIGDQSKYFMSGGLEEMDDIYTARMTDAYRSGVTDNLGGFGDFVYGVGTSAVESYLASLIPGGGLLLGANAAASAINSALDRGATSEQAFFSGLAAGAFETLFESFSIERLKSVKKIIEDGGPKALKDIVKQVAVSMGVEASEEAATEAANLLYDTIALGDISNYALAMQDYIDQGMSEDEARKKVYTEFGLQIGEAALSGAVMGGVKTGAKAVETNARVAHAKNKYFTEQGKKILNSSDANSIIEEYKYAANEFKDVDSVAKAAGKYNKKATASNLGRLEEEIRAESAKRSGLSWEQKKKEISKAAAEEKKALAERASADVQKTMSEAHLEAQRLKISSDGVSGVTLGKMSPIVDYSGASSDKIMIKDADGNAVKLSEAELADDEVGVAYILASQLGSVDAANAFIKAYNAESEQGYISPDSFYVDWLSIQSHGQISTWEGAMEKAFSAVGDRMSEASKGAAFLTGRNLRESVSKKYEAEQEKYDKAWKDAGGKTTNATFKDTALRGKTLSQDQQDYRSFLRVYSRAMGTNVEVFYSEKGARKENGSYNRGTNTLRIDINAGIGNKATYDAVQNNVIGTLSHETVHNMRVTAPKQYEALRDFVTAELEKNTDYDLEKNVEDEIARYAAKGQKIDREDAIEEIVARACEDRLGSSEALRDFLADLYAHDKDAANGFVKAVKEFLTRLKEFFEKIAKMKSTAPEAQKFAEMGGDIVSELQKLFDEGVLAMREGNMARNAVKENRSAAINGTMDMDRSDTSVDANSIATLRSIGRKSINEFTTEDIKKSELWAKRFYRELGVKSPFFRAWFGDWRAYDTSKANHVIFSTEINNRIEADLYIKDGLKKQSLYRGEIINKDSGFLINIGAHIYNDTLTYANRQYSRDNNETKYIDRISLLAQIEDIVKKSILLDTETVKEESKNDNQLFVHRFYCIAQNDGRSYLVKLTVDELNSNLGSVRRAYNLDNIEISPVAVSQDLSPADTTDDIDRDKLSTISISDLFSFVKRYDKNFSPKPVERMLLNDNGTPKVFYHGTSEKFYAFSTDEIADREGSFFFAENKEDAQAYGKNIFEVYLTGKNFADYDNQPLEFYRLRNKRAQVEYLKEHGYDGWYADMDSDGWGEVSVFSPSQIKSANYNVGTFDSSNEDIRYQDRDTKYMEAVNRGDMETAQKMVDEAAKEAGYTVKAYHGTKSDFTVFEKSKIRSGATLFASQGDGFYFTENKEVANKYSKVGKVLNAYLKMENAFVFVDKNNKAANNLLKEFAEQKGNDFNISEFSEWVNFEKRTGAVISKIVGGDGKAFTRFLQENGYDGIVYNSFNYDTGKSDKCYVVFDSNQVKAAGPITYDDNGNVIPLSERFNAEQEDIRYQDREFSSQVDDVLNGADTNSTHLKVMSTPTLLQEAGLPNLPILMTASHLKKITAKSGHGMDVELVKKLPNYISDPVMIADSLTRDDSVVIFTEAVDSENRPVIAAILLNGTGEYENKYIDANIMTSAYGKDNFQSFFDRTVNSNSVIYWNKKKSQEMSVNLGLQLPNILTSLDSNTIIRKAKAFVNTKSKNISDTTELTQRRDNLPSSSEILADVFKSGKAYEKYAEHSQSLKKYKDLQVRLRNSEKRIAEIDAEIKALRSERKQNGKGTRMDELYRMRKTAENKVESFRNQMFEMEAGDLYKVIISESQRLVEEQRKKDYERYKEKSKERTQNISKRGYIEMIEKRVKLLSKAITENSKDKHVPEIFKKTIGDFISAIDFSSKRALGGGAPTGKELSIAASMNAMADTLANSAQNPELSTYLEACDLKGDVAEAFAKIAKKINDIALANGNNNALVLQQMTVEELKALSNSVRTITHLVSAANKLIGDNRYARVEDLFIQTVEDLKNFKEYSRKKDGIGEKLGKMFEWDNALPYYAFKRMGKAAFSLFEEFQDGFDDFAFKARDIVEYTEKLYNSKESRTWTDEIHEIKLDNDRTVYMTTADIMSLYCLSKRTQARNHLFQGGIRLNQTRTGHLVGEEKAKKKTYANNQENVVIDEPTLLKILSKLTERQREVADGLQKFMADECAKWGNEISMKRFGVPQFLDPTYFPITSSSVSLEKSENSTQEKTIYALLNASFTQKLNPDASNTVEVSDIFDVFATHAVEMAKYHAFAIPLIDMRKWENFRIKTETNLGAQGTGVKEKGVREMLKNAFGDEAERYITTFLKDINSLQDRERGADLLRSLASKYKVQAVAANINVALIQPISYIRVSAVMNPKYMLEEVKDTFKIREAIKKAEKHSGMMVWKSLGYRDVNIAASLSDKIKHTESMVEMLTENVTLKGAELADKLTWGAIWIACENEITDTRKDLSSGSEEYNKAVSRRFREVIYATQVIDSPLTKTQFMRGKSFWNSLTGAFMSEPSLSYNLFLDVATDIMDDKRKGKKLTSKHITRLGRATIILLTSSFAEALIRSFFDALHDYDEEDEEYLDLYFSNFWETFLSSTFAPKTPILKTVYEAFKGAIEGAFGSSAGIDIAFAQKLGRLGRNIVRAFQGKDVSWTTFVKSIFDAFSSLSGIPLSNVWREVKSIWNIIVGSQNPSALIK